MKQNQRIFTDIQLEIRISDIYRDTGNTGIYRYPARDKDIRYIQGYW